MERASTADRRTCGLQRPEPGGGRSRPAGRGTDRL